MLGKAGVICGPIVYVSTGRRSKLLCEIDSLDLQAGQAECFGGVRKSKISVATGIFDSRTT